MHLEDSVVVSVRSARVNERPYGLEVVGSVDTGCYRVVELNILVLI